MEHLKATSLTCLTIGAMKFQRTGETAVSPQATLSISLWSLEVLSISSMVFFKYSYFLSVISGHQKVYLKRDSQMEATSHFIPYNCKSLRHTPVTFCQSLYKSSPKPKGRAPVSPLLMEECQHMF